MWHWDLDAIVMRWISDASSMESRLPRQPRPYSRVYELRKFQSRTIRQQPRMRRLLLLSNPIRWTCPRCMSTLSTLSPSILPKPDATSNLSDDQLLRDIFDSNDVWAAFNSTKSIPTGLFQYRDLTNPGGFKVFADRTLAKAQRLVEEISAGKRRKTIIKDLDRLSDILCSVSDLTGFIRTAHPDRQFAETANETFSDVVEYMNNLNQHQQLYELTA